mgnify:CR=1 FL=1
MIKVEVIEEFTLEKFKELKNIVRKGREEEGRLFVGDTFECETKMAEYLIEKNTEKRPFVKVIEIVSEDAKVEENASNKKQEAEVQVKEKKTTKNTKKKNTKKES